MINVRSFKAKNWVFELEYQRMNTFESVQCWEKWCSINEKWSHMHSRKIAKIGVHSVEMSKFYYKPYFAWNHFGDLEMLNLQFEHIWRLQILISMHFGTFESWNSPIWRNSVQRMLNLALVVSTQWRKKKNSLLRNFFRQIKL